MIRTTPFHPRTSALNQTGLWEHWSNHLAAVRYQMSEKFEYFAIRNSAGLFDSSPLYKYRISGPDAERFLAGVMVRDIRTCSPGHAQYTAWCDDRGYVIEDGVVLRHGPEEFLLTAAEPNLAYFEGLTGRLDVGIEEVSDAWAVLAIQGPRSLDVLQPHTDVDLAGLRYYAIAEGHVAGMDALVARTGYTGEDGFEIFVDWGRAGELWDVLLPAVQAAEGLPVGLGARDTLRLEAGMPLYGNELDRTTNPFEANLGRVVKLDKANDFVGRTALEKVAAGGPARRLVGLVMEGRGIARHGYPVHAGERRTGVVTSGTQSPTIGSPIAMAYVATGDAEPGTVLDVEIRDQRVPARVVPLPFYARASS